MVVLCSCHPEVTSKTLDEAFVSQQMLGSLISVKSIYTEASGGEKQNCASCTRNICNNISDICKSILGEDISSYNKVEIKEQLMQKGVSVCQASLNTILEKK